MDDKKLSPKWHLILVCLAFVSALSIYPVWHVLIAERVLAESRQSGKVAKAVVHYSPSSLRSYLGAYFPEMRSCGIRLIVRGPRGELLRSMQLTNSTSHLPGDLRVFLDWDVGGTDVIGEVLEQGRFLTSFSIRP